VDLKERDASMAANFDYQVGTRVEIDVGLLGRVLPMMPEGVSAQGTLPPGATRIGFILSYNHTSGRAVIDVPDVVELNIFQSFLEITLPDMLVYPIPLTDRYPGPACSPVPAPPATPSSPTLDHQLKG
jgi:hypothetical protein